MLIEFSVENFLSIKERATLSMVATSDKKLSGNTFSCGALPTKLNKLSKTAVLYGPNASGKSNLLKALRFLKAIILNSHKNQLGDELGVVPFKLNEESIDIPSSFEIIFIQNDIRYAYGIKLDNTKIYEEYLYYWPNSRKKTVFERWNTNQFKFFEQGDTESEKTRQQIYLETTLENTLFLSQATKLKHEIATEAFNWFRTNIRFIIDHEEVSSFTSHRIAEEPTLKDKIIKYLKRADFSILDIKINREELSPSQIPQHIRSQLLESIKSTGGTKAELDKLKIGSLEEHFYHRGKTRTGEELLVPLEIDEESDGTQAFYSLIGAIDYVLTNGCVIAIDELDLHLHPLLSRYIVDLFLDRDKNFKNAQLIFTTHNLDLFDQKLFRRDQIWLIEKDRYYGDTQLFALSEFKVRNDADILKRYLQGRYGAIPLVD